ncbi:DUF3179 domain-containing protein [Salinirubellus salinus]|uniref:DUF3179 domain-containing protein n=1 Tax=Salinirubellus salinus TaxID=1364945 RepID=A0A9E7R2H4_9EURY|nr:DUF3179 domain-containing protein [Salinirubellus salinus]UWM54509.1 DUF3179 domain-containing protein [Salinirubellus salinus]
MHRRQLLLGLAGVGTAAGALGYAAFTPRRDDEAPSPTSTPAETEPPAARGDPADYGRVADEALPIPVADMLNGLPKDAIRSITEPAFGPDWADLTITHFPGTEREFQTEPRLTDHDTVVGVVREGEARAYPLRVLAGHEVVNDEFHGPLLVTYCPVCASSIVAVREVRGEEATFGVSGLLWKLNLVMYDRETRSLWTQAEMVAINGELTGERLELVPSTLTKWGAWREEFPDTAVLLPPPLSKPLYYGQPGMNATGTYLQPATRAPGSPEAADFDRGQFTHVLGVEYGVAARAYPLPVVVEERVVNDVVGGVPVVVTVAPGTSLVAYERRVRGRTLTFEAWDDRHLRAGGSRWRRLTGLAVDGPFEGERLVRATDVPQLFWETWRDFNPDTTVYGDYTFSRD